MPNPAAAPLPADLTHLTLPELVALAQARGVEVRRDDTFDRIATRVINAYLEANGEVVLWPI